MQPTNPPQDGSSPFDEYADHYWESISPLVNLAARDNGYFTAAKANVIAHDLAVRGLRPADLVMVDVGTGHGTLGAAVGGEFHAFWGFDRSRPMLRIATQSAHLRRGGYVAADAGRLPAPAASADVVVAAALFHHLSDADREATAAEMLRVCRPGGALFIFEHNPFHPLTQVIVRTTKLDRDARLLTPSALTAIFRRAGASQQRVRYLLFAPALLDRLLMRHARWLTRWPVGGQYVLRITKA